jgi:hypothetical protein
MPDLVLNKQIREDLSTILYLRKKIMDLYLLSHTLPKESRKYDEVIEEKVEAFEKLNQFNVNTTITASNSMLTILVWMYEHPYSKVTHPLFEKNEFIFFDSEENVIKDEKGRLFEDWDENSTSYNGIMIRTAEAWKTGWRLV